MTDQIVNLLQSNEPLQRKKGIGAAAKSADTRYLKPLAQIYKTDPDPELREIARKAGVYITRNQPEKQPVPAPASAAPPADEDDSFVALRGDLMGEMTEEEPEPALEQPDLLDDDIPTADDILGVVPPVAFDEDARNPEIAEVHYNTAFELHLKGRDARAVLELATAFKLNPTYLNDPTAIALASELTGISGNEVAAYMTDTRNWEDMVERLGGIQASPEDRAWVSGFALWALGVLTIVAIFAAFIILVQSDQFVTAVETVVEETMDNLFGGAANGVTSPE